MTAYLCITVRFADPTFHGRSEGGVPEWPPSPLRLFQALIAASVAKFGNSDRFRDYTAPAFEWLAGLHPPTVVAPAGVSGVPFRMAVPNNDLDVVARDWARRVEPNKQPAELKTLKAVSPTYMVGGGEFPAVHYLWEVADADQAACEQHKEALFAAAGCLVTLGWGIDMAIGNGRLLTKEDADGLAGQRWRPVTGSSPIRLRVPRQDTLAALTARHESFLNRLPSSGGFVPVPPLAAFATVGYRRDTDVAGRPHAAFRLLHPVLEQSAWFSATRANCVAAMTRHATANAANQQPQDWVDSYVHGHRSSGEDTKPRFSYLPLPTIEHRGESGRVIGGIRRVILAELIEASTSYLTWARQMLPGQFLIDEESRERRAMLAPLNDSDWVLRQYTALSDTWATVTPVVLPGSDEGKFAKAEKLFFKALRYGGYSAEALAELEFRNVSFWPGRDLLALRFQRPEYLRRDHWSVYHMRIRWHRPAKGPLAIGAGRHCGLGVFAAMGD